MFIIPYKYKCHLTAKWDATDYRKHYQQHCQGLGQNTTATNAYIQDVTYKIPFTLCNSYRGIVVMCLLRTGEGGGAETSTSLSLNTESQRNIFNINAINFSFSFNK